MAGESSQAEEAQSTASSVSNFQNPLANGPANDPNAAAIGTSVVHDLMSVYESLTQSSTPQTSSHPPLQKPPAPPQHSVVSHHTNHPQYPNNQDQTILPQPPTNHQMQPPETQHTMQSTDQVYHQPQNPQHAQQIQYHHQMQPYAVPSYTTFQHPYGAPVQQQAFATIEAQPKQTQSQLSDDSDETDSDQARSRKKSRRGSGGSVASIKGRKKSKTSDGRWSKRFTWPDDLHRDFVSSIFDVGLKHSSPSTIIEHMPKHPDITTERIKSHLQKYRLHRAKSKQDFMSSYETSLLKFQEKGTAGVKALTNGEVAAHLTYTSTTDPSKLLASEPARSQGQSVAYAPKVNEALMLPQLTEAEKNSPVGAAMGYLMGLFFSLKQQLAMQRASSGNGETIVAAPAPLVAHVPANSVHMTQGEVAHHNGHSSQEKLDANPDSPKDGSPAASHPTPSRNIEESFMEQDLKHQRVFRHKMRALKQQELNKCTKGQEEIGVLPKEAETLERNGGPPTPAGRFQFAAEARSHEGHANDEEGRSRGMSIGASEDFWNTDIVDEQLFEFLMNN